ncbi:hypothetical protein SEMRO_2296_G322380.1 [Seminavis robusta]|uniref:Uncharacterized protein n=1 Tax=Seminavis robusta TaxID=568900 RepID=A0A9N8HWX1_9STRA|nr:hypothetical protein SEMRO_2296_G322380.1 [Seminavis robusta]|eukprot:Sro2296_g322380.1 n/a (428) ;mRNA; f:12639-14001
MPNDDPLNDRHSSNKRAPKNVDKHQSSTMPRTKSTKKQVDPNDNPIARWNKLKHHDKVICWNYWRWIVTNGEEGWDTDCAGSIHHQRSSQLLLNLGSDSWFRHRGKQMVTLAQKFAQLNQQPPENPKDSAPTADNELPEPPLTRVHPRNPRNPTPPPFFRDTFATPPTSPTPTMNAAGMRSPKVVKKTVKAPAPAPAYVPSGGGDHPGLTAPTSFGMFRKFNYTSRRTEVAMLCRMILHNGATVEDIEFEWQAPRLLMIRVAWPDWFQMAEQMAQFCVDDQGQMLYPPDHPLTMDTSERNQQLVEEDDRIWDYGYLQFDQDMLTEEEPAMELLEVDIESRGVKVNVLQLFVKVLPEDDGKKSNKVKSGRTVKLGAGPRPGGTNVRTSSSQEESSRGGKRTRTSHDVDVETEHADVESEDGAMIDGDY